MASKSMKLPPIVGQQTSTATQNTSKQNSTLYNLDGSQHYLPAKTSLRPNQDTFTGEIETWPAHASQTGSKHCILDSVQNRKLSLAKSAALKPKFLTALETYAQKEIIVLQCPDSQPSDLRLQAYREVFEYLIEDFKTYKPLLSQIKNEYERTLAHCRQQIRELEPLKSMLVTVSEKCEQKIQKIREEEQTEIKELNKQRMELLQHIDKMRENEKALKAQVARLQEDLSVEYKKYRNECDMRKLLISDMNDMRHQQEDLKRAAGQGFVDAADDPVKLKLALKVARDDLTRAAAELNRIRADYGDVVPRRDFEMLEAKHNQMLEEEEQNRKDFAQLKQEHDTMLEVHQQVLTQRDEFYTEAETMKQSATPRPSWQKLGDVVSGGAEGWHDATKGKSSADILELVVDQLKQGGGSSKSFDGRGLGENVPKYLRFEGTIRNRGLSKPELSTLVKQIWASKVASDAEVGQKQHMADYLYDFFTKKFSGDEELAAEWGYSLHDAIERNQEQPNVAFLHDVLQGQATEEFYYHHMEVIKSLMTELSKLDADGAGTVTPELMQGALSTAYKLKSQPSVEALLAACLEELGETMDSQALKYKDLFTEDEDGNTGAFLNLLRQQENEEIATYVDELSQQLEAAEEVTLLQMRQTFFMMDPTLEPAQMAQYLRLAFGCSPAELDDVPPQAQADIIKRLPKSGVHRFGAVY